MAWDVHSDEHGTVILSKKRSPASLVTRNEQPRVDDLRVVFVVAQTRPVPGWCRMLVSSVFSNISVVTLGVGKAYRHSARPLWVLQFVEAEELRDEDVIVMVDGADNIFTGALTVKKALDKFIAATAPTADTFDSASVRRGETFSPMIFSGDPLCYTPQLETFVPLNGAHYSTVCQSLFDEARERAGMKNRSSDNPAESGNSAVQHLNAGGFVARVWALKKATAAYNAMLRSRENVWCDQTVWTLLYLRSLGNESDVPPEMLLQFGILGVDYHVHFFLIVFPRVLDVYFKPWDDKTVRQTVTTDQGSLPLLFDIGERKNGSLIAFHLFLDYQNIPGILWKFVPYLPWVREVNRDAHTKLMAKKRLANNDTLADMREAMGTQKRSRFADMCPVEDVLRMKWLASPLGK